MNVEPTDGEALETADEHDEVVAVTGDGIKTRKVRNDCPICVGGTSLACSWHFE